MDTQDNAVDEDGFDSSAYFPVLTTLADAPVRRRTLSMFAELSFMAGREGDATADWRDDMSAAVDKAFASLRPDRREEVKELLTTAFYAGHDLATIAAAPMPERAMQFAKAKATLLELHYDPTDVVPAALEARATAYLLAHKLPIEADEAAACAIAAFREAGFEVPERESSFVLEGAGNAVRDREAWEAAEREFEEREQALTDSILTGEARA
jgi:hypothetical protein